VSITTNAIETNGVKYAALSGIISVRIRSGMGQCIVAVFVYRCSR